VDKSAHLSNSVTNVAGRQQLRVDPAIPLPAGPSWKTQFRKGFSHR
jgi:hypothetical protein